MIGSNSEDPKKGIEVNTAADRDNYPNGLRFWGMQISVTSDPTPANNTTWVLVKGLADTDQTNNDNWQKIADFIFTNSTLSSGNGLSYKKMVTGFVLNGVGPGGVFGINNPNPWANDSVVYVRVKVIGVETTTPGASGFFYTLEGTFIKDNAGVVTKIAAVTAADDNPKNVRNSTGVAVRAANVISVAGGSLFVDVQLVAAPLKNYNLTLEVEYFYTT